MDDAKRAANTRKMSKNNSRKNLAGRDSVRELISTVQQSKNGPITIKEDENPEKYAEQEKPTYKIKVPKPPNYQPAVFSISNAAKKKQSKQDNDKSPLEKAAAKRDNSNGNFLKVAENGVAASSGAQKGETSYGEPPQRTPRNATKKPKKNGSASLGGVHVSQIAPLKDRKADLLDEAEDDSLLKVLDTSVQLSNKSKKNESMTLKPSKTKSVQKDSAANESPTKNVRTI